MFMKKIKVVFFQDHLFKWFMVYKRKHLFFWKYEKTFSEGCLKSWSEKILKNYPAGTKIQDICIFKEINAPV